MTLPNKSNSNAELVPLMTITLPTDFPINKSSLKIRFLPAENNCNWRGELHGLPNSYALEPETHKSEVFREDKDRLHRIGATQYRVAAQIISTPVITPIITPKEISRSLPISVASPIDSTRGGLTPSDRKQYDFLSTKTSEPWRPSQFAH